MSAQSNVGKNDSKHFFKYFARGRIKRTEEGKFVFHPWGFLGKGYLLESKEHAERIQVWLGKFALLSIILVILIMRFDLDTNIYAGIYVAVVIPIYGRKMRNELRGLLTTDKPLAFPPKQRFFMIATAVAIILGCTIYLFDEVTKKNHFPQEEQGLLALMLITGLGGFVVLRKRVK